MNDTTKLIDLYGRLGSILFKDKNLLIFSFFDKTYGQLCCTAKKNESILYYNIESDIVYHLQVKLVGHELEDDGGKTIVNNYLHVKKAVTI